MLNDVFEQFQTASKPFTDLLALSTETSGQLLRKQGEFVSELFTESFEFSKDVMAQKDIGSIAELQRKYLESMQERATANGQQVYSDLTEAQEKTMELVKEVFNKTGEVASEAASKVTGN